MRSWHQRLLDNEADAEISTGLDRFWLGPQPIPAREGRRRTGICRGRRDRADATCRNHIRARYHPHNGKPPPWLGNAVRSRRVIVSPGRSTRGMAASSRP